MTADSFTVRELDTRWTNGIHVRLLWCQHDGRVSVAVADTRSGESFRVDARDGERPLDVFRHPFAYAPPQHVDRACVSRLEAGSENDDCHNDLERDRERVLS